MTSNTLAKRQSNNKLRDWSVRASLFARARVASSFFIVLSSSTSSSGVGHSRSSYMRGKVIVHVSSGAPIKATAMRYRHRSIIVTNLLSHINPFVAILFPVIRPLSVSDARIFAAAGFVTALWRFEDTSTRIHSLSACAQNPATACKYVLGLYGLFALRI